MKLRPDLQALVDAEVERRRVEDEERQKKVLRGFDEGVHLPKWQPVPVEPYLVPRTSPLVDAVNVHLVLQAERGKSINPIVKAPLWPNDLAFPMDRVVPAVVVRERKEQEFAQIHAASERRLAVEYWSQAPWLVAENYGGYIHWPNGGAIIKRGSRGVTVLGVGELDRVEERWDPRYRERVWLGEVIVGGTRYRAVAGSTSERFERDGLVYDVPVIEVLGKSRRRP